MNDMPVYRTMVYDSRRWEGFEFRGDDIIINTPPKSGTTWTQMLVAMLVFRDSVFPDVMDNLSPWLDMNTRSRDEVFDLLATQTHRRFIKTHTPLNGLPRAPGVKYVVVARDPRDVAVSMDHHFANMDFDAFMATRAAAVGNDDLDDFPPPPEPTDDTRERLRRFIESEAPITNFDSVVGHLRDAWDHRHDPDVALFHYRDYQQDLPGELRRMAAFLGVELSEEQAAAFASESDISKMRARAQELAPDTAHNHSHWLDTARFFRSAGRGEWSEDFDEELARRYEERIEEYAKGDGDFIAWAHEGRLAPSIELPR